MHKARMGRVRAKRMTRKGSRGPPWLAAEVAAPVVRDGEEETREEEGEGDVVGYEDGNSFHEPRLRVKH